MSRASAPHLLGGNSVARVMGLVLLALLPCALVHVWLYGLALPRQWLVASSVALAAEWLALRLRGQPSLPALRDGSALVSAALLVFCLPPQLPWWITAFASASAVLLGKQAFGGLGQNPFNPAMVGYVVALVAFPVEMTRWPAPVDAYSGATALLALQDGLTQRLTMAEIRALPAFGAVGAAGAEWLALAALAGGLALLALRVIRWHIPAGVLGGLALAAAVGQAFDAGAHAGPLFHLFAGASMFGAFFIATDPVSAATSDRGRLLYGAGIGILTYLIRAFGVHPDGFAFAVLLLNLCVPLIDRHTAPRIDGHSDA